ncbi:hypothetical protein L6452_03053 [Arctium lappa]|uniref:Uncharacterized protein n=1 Tax=Arctium lappa TaxID=4217 RepID=A0ACB9FMR8_ARCLA|nr:hypothetical protein L6452_03053 [Arctium lappa]
MFEVKLWLRSCSFLLAWADWLANTKYIVFFLNFHHHLLHLIMDEELTAMDSQNITCDFVSNPISTDGKDDFDDMLSVEEVIFDSMFDDEDEELAVDGDDADVELVGGDLSESHDHPC